jgi:hypothetical protein
MAILKQEKPIAEVLVEGELSPFEHEALYQLLRKHFTVSQPTYVELPDENLATRINVTFHHAYDARFFTEVFQQNWRDLKNIFREVRHRRGRAGAAFALAFVDKEMQLVFRLGFLDTEEMSSAIDQIGHLTSIINMIAGLWDLDGRLGRIECSFDGRSDRWQNYRGYVLSNDREVFRFDDTSSKWVRAE